MEERESAVEGSTAGSGETAIGAMMVFYCVLLVVWFPGCCFGMYRARTAVL